jgi:hypothetical protein
MDRTQLSKVILAYFSGMSIEEVAKAVGVSSDSKVWHLLKAAGVTLRMQNYPTRRVYNGVSYRSSYEAAFSKFLDEAVGNSSYTPDFYIPAADTYVELKGYERGNQAVRRAEVVAKYGIHLVVLGKEELEMMGVI